MCLLLLPLLQCNAGNIGAKCATAMGFDGVCTRYPSMAGVMAYGCWMLVRVIVGHSLWQDSLRLSYQRTCRRSNPQPWSMPATMVVCTIAGVVLGNNAVDR